MGAGPTWRCRGTSVVRVCGIRGCAKVHGVFLIFVGGVCIQMRFALIGQAKVNQGGGGHGG